MITNKTRIDSPEMVSLETIADLMPEGESKSIIVITTPGIGNEIAKLFSVRVLSTHESEVVDGNSRIRTQYWYGMINKKYISVLSDTSLECDNDNIIVVCI